MILIWITVGGLCLTAFAAAIRIQQKNELPETSDEELDALGRKLRKKAIDDSIGIIEPIVPGKKSTRTYHVDFNDGVLFKINRKKLLMFYPNTKEPIVYDVHNFEEVYYLHLLEMRNVGDSDQVILELCRKNLIS